jgi:hypothetical protein
VHHFIKHIFHQSAVIERVEYTADNEKKRDYGDQSSIARSTEYQYRGSDPFPEGNASFYIRKFTIGINDQITVAVFNTGICTAGDDQCQNISENHQNKDDYDCGDKGSRAYVGIAFFLCFHVKPPS